MTFLFNNALESSFWGNNNSKTPYNGGFFPFWWGHESPKKLIFVKFLTNSCGYAKIKKSSERFSSYDMTDILTESKASHWQTDLLTDKSHYTGVLSMDQKRQYWQFTPLIRDGWVREMWFLTVIPYQSQHDFGRHLVKNPHVYLSDLFKTIRGGVRGYFYHI